MKLANLSKMLGGSRGEVAWVCGDVSCGHCHANTTKMLVAMRVFQREQHAGAGNNMAKESIDAGDNTKCNGDIYRLNYWHSSIRGQYHSKWMDGGIDEG